MPTKLDLPDEILKKRFLSNFKNINSENELHYAFVRKTDISDSQFNFYFDKERMLSGVKDHIDANADNNFLEFKYSLYLVPESTVYFLNDETDRREPGEYYTNIIEQDGILIADDKELRQYIENNKDNIRDLPIQETRVEEKILDIEENIWPSYDPFDPAWQGAAEELKFTAKEFGYELRQGDLQDLEGLSKKLTTIETGRKIGTDFKEAMEELKVPNPNNIDPDLTPEAYKAYHEQFKKPNNIEKLLASETGEQKTLATIRVHEIDSTFQSVYINPDVKETLDNILYYEKQPSNPYEFQIYSVDTSLLLNIDTFQGDYSYEYNEQQAEIIRNNGKLLATNEQIKEYLNKTPDLFYILSPKEGVIGKNLTKEQGNKIIEEKGGTFSWHPMSQYNEENIRKHMDEFYHIKNNVNNENKNIKTSENLFDETIESEFSNQIKNNYDKYKEQYLLKFGTVIGGDNAKELSEKYILNPTKYTSSVHEPASEFSKKLFKSLDLTFEMPFLTYDSNMSNLGTSKHRIDESLKNGKNVKILFVHRDPTEAYIDGVIPRMKTEGRSVTVDCHIDTFKKSLSTIKNLHDIYKENNNVSFYFINNATIKDNRIETDKIKRIRPEELFSQNFNVEQIKNNIYEKLKEFKQQGSLTDEQWRASTEIITGRSSSASIEETRTGQVRTEKETQGKNLTGSQYQSTGQKTSNFIRDRVAIGWQHQKEEKQPFFKFDFDITTLNIAKSDPKLKNAFFTSKTKENGLFIKKDMVHISVYPYQYPDRLTKATHYAIIEPEGKEKSNCVFSANIKLENLLNIAEIRKSHDKEGNEKEYPHSRVDAKFIDKQKNPGATSEIVLFQDTYDKDTGTFSKNPTNIGFANKFVSETDKKEKQQQDFKGYITKEDAVNIEHFFDPKDYPLLDNNDFKTILNELQYENVIDDTKYRATISRLGENLEL